MNSIYTFIDKLRRNEKIKYFFNLLSLISVIYLLNLIISEEVKFKELFNYTTIFVFTILLIFYSFLAISWSALMKNGEIKKNYIIHWFYSVIGKYIPLGVGIPLLRFETKDSGLNDGSEKILKNTIKELLLIILSSSSLALIFFVEIYFGIPSFTLKVISVVVVIYSLILFLLKININFLNYLITNSFVSVFIAYLTYLQFGAVKLEFILGYLISSIISIIAIGIPAGLGIREAVFIQLMNFSGTYADVEIFIATTRIYLILFDLFIFTIMRFNKKLYK